MPLNSLSIDPERQELMQPLLHPLDSVPIIEYVPFEGLPILPEQCLPIAGLQIDGRFVTYSHVVRRVVAARALSLPVNQNTPHEGTDKFIFFNFDVQQKFYWQSTYSSALFVDGSLQIMTI